MKRNQVRQKLATFQNERFKEFVVQLMMEIEKRYPGMKSRISMLPTRTSTRQSTLRKKVADRENAASEPGRRRRAEDNPRSNSVKQQSVYQDNSMSALDALRKEYEQKLSHMEAQIAKKDDVVAALKESVMKLEKEQFQSKSSNSQVDQERQRAQRETDALNAKNSKLQRELDLCRKELQQEQKIAQEAETLCEKLEAKYNKVFAEKENMAQEILKRRGDSTKTTKEFDLISKELMVCQAEKTAAILARDSLKDDVAKCKSEIDNLKSQLKKVEVDRLNTMVIIINCSLK
jgi:chromosome segregation ATPase